MLNGRAYVKEKTNDLIQVRDLSVLNKWLWIWSLTIASEKKVGWRQLTLSVPQTLQHRSIIAKMMVRTSYLRIYIIIIQNSILKQR